MDYYFTRKISIAVYHGVEGMNMEDFPTMVHVKLVGHDAGGDVWLKLLLMT